MRDVYGRSNALVAQAFNASNVVCILCNDWNCRGMQIIWSLPRYSSRALFSSRIREPDLGTVATVPVSEHCSNFCFLVQKIIQKLIN
jgi:hypothetical protein